MPRWMRGQLGAEGVSKHLYTRVCPSVCVHVCVCLSASVCLRLSVSMYDAGQNGLAVT